MFDPRPFPLRRLFGLLSLALNPKHRGDMFGHRADCPRCKAKRWAA